MRRTSLAVIAFAAATVSACGGSSAGNALQGLSPVAALAAASTKTTQAGTAKVALDVKSTVAGKAIEITGAGAFRLDGTAGIFNVSLNPGSGQPLTLEERTVDGVLYLKAPPLGDSFYALKTAALIGTSLGQSTDPTIGLSMLFGASDDVRQAGTDTVRGTTTTHYKGTYQLRKATDKVGGPFAKAFAQQLVANGDTAVPFDAYVDAQGRLRRLIQILTVKAQGRAVSSTSTTEFYDFGTPVAVMAPAADKVKDGTALLKGLSG